MTGWRVVFLCSAHRVGLRTRQVRDGMGSRSFRSLALTAALAVMVGGLATAADAVPAGAPVVAPGHALAGPTGMATLITGDRVALGTTASGTPTASVIRAIGEGPGS